MTQTVEPLFVGIREACVMTGMSRSAIYRALSAGEVRAKKLGSKTLIPTGDLKAFLAALPPATFRPAA